MSVAAFIVSFTSCLFAVRGMFTLSILDERRAVVTTAALRSAVAWSRRADEPRAWREVARMTGVVMGAFGPGAGR